MAQNVYEIQKENMDAAMKSFGRVRKLFQEIARGPQGVAGKGVGGANRILEDSA